MTTPTTPDTPPLERDDVTAGRFVHVFTGPIAAIRCSPLSVVLTLLTLIALFAGSAYLLLYHLDALYSNDSNVLSDMARLGILAAPLLLTAPTFSAITRAALADQYIGVLRAWRTSAEAILPTIGWGTLITAAVVGADRAIRVFTIEDDLLTNWLTIGLLALTFPVITVFMTASMNGNTTPGRVIAETPAVRLLVAPYLSLITWGGLTAAVIFALETAGLTDSSLGEITFWTLILAGVTLLILGNTGIVSTNTTQIPDQVDSIDPGTRRRRRWGTIAAVAIVAVGASTGVASYLISEANQTRDEEAYREFWERMSAFDQRIDAAGSVKFTQVDWYSGNTYAGWVNVADGSIMDVTETDPNGVLVSELRCAPGPDTWFGDVQRYCDYRTFTPAPSDWQEVHLTELGDPVIAYATDDAAFYSALVGGTWERVGDTFVLAYDDEDGRTQYAFTVSGDTYTRASGVGAAADAEVTIEPSPHPYIAPDANVGTSSTG